MLSVTLFLRLSLPFCCPCDLYTSQCTRLTPPFLIHLFHPRYLSITSTTPKKQCVKTEIGATFWPNHHICKFTGWYHPSPAAVVWHLLNLWPSSESSHTLQGIEGYKYQTHSIPGTNGTNLPTNLPYKSTIHLGKYTSPMDYMGNLLGTGFVFLTGQSLSSGWWFQPLRKILVKMGIFPK